MCSAQVRRGIVIRAISLKVTACFAVGQELTGFGNITADPHPSHFHVVALDVAAEFVVAVEALGLVVAERAKGGFALGLASRLTCDGGLVTDYAVFGRDGDSLWLEFFVTR